MEGADLQDCGKRETSERVRDSETHYSLIREFDRISSGFLWPVGATPTANSYVG
jgi:hypothetical protein